MNELPPHRSGSIGSYVKLASWTRARWSIPPLTLRVQLAGMGYLPRVLPDPRPAALKRAAHARGPMAGRAGSLCAETEPAASAKPTCRKGGRAQAPERQPCSIAGLPTVKPLALDRRGFCTASGAPDLCQGKCAPF